MRILSTILLASLAIATLSCTTDTRISEESLRISSIYDSLWSSGLMILPGLIALVLLLRVISNLTRIFVQLFVLIVILTLLLSILPEIQLSQVLYRNQQPKKRLSPVSNPPATTPPLKTDTLLPVANTSPDTPYFSVTTPAEDFSPSKTYWVDEDEFYNY